MTRSSDRLVFVTGAAGFLGRHVAATFARAGWRVIGLGNGCIESGDRVRLGLRDWVQGGVDSTALRGLIDRHGEPGVVVHAAGGASVRAAIDDPDEDRRRTVDSTREVLDALRRRAPWARLVLPSSAAVYGNGHSEPIPETAVPAPISAYGRHKLRAEELCLEAARQDGQPVTIVRFFSLYGTGLRKQIFWDLWNKFRQGDRIVLGGTGGETRDFLHVCDGARLFLHIAEGAGPADPPIVNGGTGQATAIRDAVRMAQRLSGHDAPLVFDGKPRPGDPKHLVAAVDGLATIGFRRRIALADGLADYAPWADHAARLATPHRATMAVSRLMEAP